MIGVVIMIDFKGSQFERDIIPWAVTWYAAYPLTSECTPG